MKKYICIMLMLLALSSLCCCYYDDSAKYPNGRDTVVYVDDGRFQIFRYPNDLPGKELYYSYGVNDAETSESIEPDVFRYFDNKKDKKLYLIGCIGCRGYTVIDYDNAMYEQHEKLHEFSEEDIKVFCTDYHFKTLAKKVSSRS